MKMHLPSFYQKRPWPSILRRAGFNTLLLCLLAGAAQAQEPSFYEGPQLFSTAPKSDKSEQSIGRFGPVGMSITLTQPAFVMKVGTIEPGSPAEACGKLKTGQIIETINGAKLKDVDPRILLGDLITIAEASDGVIKFMVKDSADTAAKEVIVRIPVLGAYSTTWPLNCPKSEKIIRNFIEYLKKPDSPKGFAWTGYLVLLGTGDDNDLAPVREWVHGMANANAPQYPWHLGYGGIPLCEYYLRTGDPTALPIIQKWVDNAVKSEYLGGWSQKGGAGNVGYGGGGGHLNAAGTHVLTMLLLAKECGADVPDRTLHDVLTHFYRWAGRGNNPYGDNFPEKGFVDNGKNGKLAFAMAAAASLTPDGENSVYAGARDATALTAFYSTSFMLHGHTGGGIGEIWRSASMSLLAHKRPEMYRDFLDSRRWHYEMSRRFDGSFAILGGERYDNEGWGAAYAMTYIIPRKTLRVTGAPPTKFSKPFKLPERPWGTKADDVFASIEPATMADGTKPDFTTGTIAKDSGKPMLYVFANPDIDDTTIRRYAHHPDSYLRLMAARRAMGMSSTYLGHAEPIGDPRKELALELFHSKDPRVRQAVLLAMVERSSTGEELMAFLGQKGFDELIGMLRSPDESWWVQAHVLFLVSRASADVLALHAELLAGFLKHEEWWLQSAALSALAPLVADERCYRIVVPAIAEMARTCQRWNATGPLRWGALADNIRQAGPEVRKLMAEQFKDTYLGFTGVKKSPGGLDLANNFNSHKSFLAETLTKVPGGYDLLYEVSKENNPNSGLPYAKLFLEADFESFGPELRKALGPIIREQLIPEYMVNNRTTLFAEAEAVVQSQFIEDTALDGLVDLYRKTDVHEYGWRPFGPDLKEATWNYLTFTPADQPPHDRTVTRYREVDLPVGSEHWFQNDFDSAKAGWKQGHQPFGQYNGLLVPEPGKEEEFKTTCPHPYRTLWDKEVLLLQGRFEFPTLKPGHLYRLKVNWGKGVGTGDGYRLYINGKELIEVEGGVARRAGGRQRGAFITKEFIDPFGKGPVNIAAISFLRYGNKAVVTMPPIPQGSFCIEMEEMKIPPLDATLFRKATTAVGLRSASWQAMQDPDDADRSLEDGLFRYDGNFVPNSKVPGAWETLSVLADGETFDPSKRGNPKGAPFRQITFNEGGTTDSLIHFWSGDIVMDLGKRQALKITPQSIGGADYLFIEAGGFSHKNPHTWKSPVAVLKRAKK